MSNPSISSPNHPPVDSRLHWKGDRKQVNLVGLLRRRLLQTLWGALLLAAVGLFAWLVWLLLLEPKRTPVVVLSAAPYSWPLPPQSWTAEDIEGLAVLDGQTITLQGNETPVFQTADFLDRLDQQIDRSNSYGHRTPLVVWVSLHGVADSGDGAIRLIPPNGSPAEPESWIDFHALLDHFAKVDPRRSTLLVLDCNRMQVNWNIGLKANAFAERVQDAYRAKLAENTSLSKLAVLLSAGSDQRSYDSADLGASVFGTQMRLGMAGLADQVGNGGNGNGWVEVSELHRYVKSEVTAWSTACRGKQQTPVLLTADAGDDFRLVKCLREDSLQQVVRTSSATRKTAPAIAAARLDSLWKALDEFREQELYRNEPIAFRSLEHDLLWLEQLSVAGRGYHSLAQRTFDQVQGEIDAIKTRVARLETERTFALASSLISGRQPTLPRSLKTHSLPLAEFFGTQDVTTLAGLRSQLAMMAQQSDPERLRDARLQFAKHAKSAYATEHFLKMLDRYQTSRLWQRDKQISELVRLQTEIQDLAVPRTSDGSPGDLRTHHWNRMLLADVDTARRQIEDRILVEQQSGLDELLSQARARYQAAATGAMQRDQTLQLSDRAMAVAPYFAQWIAHPDRNVGNDQAMNQMDQLVLPLIVNTDQLSLQLASEIESPPSAAVEALLNSLYDEWANWQKRILIQSESDRVDVIGDLQAALAVPIAGWESRRDLRNALDRLTTQIQKNYAGGEVAPAGASTETVTAYSERVAAWQRHPLDAILGLQTTTGSAWENPLRQFLDQVHSELAEQALVSTLAERRRICSSAARRTRAAAPIWFPVPNRDAITALRDLDLQALLMWHAERAMADFWGPAGGRQAFYDVAASDYCESVAELDQRTRGAGENSVDLVEVQAMTSRIAASRRFLPEWIKASAEATIQLAPEDRFQTRLSVDSSAGQDFVAPHGTAAVVVRSESKRIELDVAPSDAMELPAVNSEFTITLPADLTDAGSSLNAQLIFRGHEFGGSLDVDQLGGVKVDVVAGPYRGSDVTLNGPWDNLSVLFVLDCSASMGEPLEAGSEQAQSRLEVAKSAIQEMLFNLGLRRNVRVGLRAFGHRLGWSVDEPVQPLTRPDFVGNLDPSLTPSQDVESILPLDDFALPMAQEVVPIISELQPWGQSPLYLSLMQSLNEFSAGDENADRHVIVITDGANYQFIPGSVTEVRPTTDQEVRQAWQRGRAPVHILGLGMNRNDQRDAIGEFTRLCHDTGGRFQSLSRSTDLAKALRDLLAPGNYRLLPSQDGNRPQQQERLGAPIRVAPVPKSPETFLVEFKNHELANSGGASTVTDGSSAETVGASAIEPVLLQGGESLQLYVNQLGTEIFAYPFDDNVAGASELVSSTDRGTGNTTEHLVRVHDPERGMGNRMTFPVSWQRHDHDTTTGKTRWRFTRRPSSFWIDLQPMDRQGNLVGEPYAFFDAAFAAEKPVPLMNLVADNWPQSATRARIKLWSQPASDQPASDQPASDQPASDQPASDQLAVEASALTLSPPNMDQPLGQSSAGIEVAVTINESLQQATEVSPGVWLRIDPLAMAVGENLSRRRFVVKFTDPTIETSSIKLDVDASFRDSLVRIVRQFDSQHRVSVHTFDYDAKEDAFPTVIRVTDREHELDQAWELADEFIEVSIPDSGGLLPASG